MDRPGEGGGGKGTNEGKRCKIDKKNAQDIVCILHTQLHLLEDQGRVSVLEVDESRHREDAATAPGAKADEPLVSLQGEEKDCIDVLQYSCVTFQKQRKKTFVGKVFFLPRLSKEVLYISSTPPL